MRDGIDAVTSNYHHRVFDVPMLPSDMDLDVPVWGKWTLRNLLEYHYLIAISEGLQPHAAMRAAISKFSTFYIKIFSVECCLQNHKITPALHEELKMPLRR